MSIVIDRFVIRCICCTTEAKKLTKRDENSLNQNREDGIVNMLEVSNVELLDRKHQVKRRKT